MRAFLPILCFVIATPLFAVARNVLACKASQLSAIEDPDTSHQIDGGAGNGALTIAVRNQSTYRCFLHGIPGLTLTDNAHRRLTTSVCSGCADYLFPKLPVKTIVLEPGNPAFVLLGFRIGCQSESPLTFRIADQGGTLHIAIAGMLGPNSGDDLQSCSRFNVSPFLEKPPTNGERPTLN